jgi:RHS repeat-associated protein
MAGKGVWCRNRFAFGGTTNTYFAGRMVQQSGVAFIQDRLGSNGKYFPYGEERNYPALPNDQVKFATYTRDSATGLDYADQRYYSSSLGRFVTPDPYRRSGRLAVPLSLNRYNYVGDDPISRNDPSGLCDVTVAGITQSSANAPDIAAYGSSHITRTRAVPRRVLLVHYKAWLR